MIAGMGQRMPQRPQMGPSPMTAGRPNPMAGFGGGFQGKPQGPPMGGGGPQQPPPWAQGGAQGMQPWMKPPPPPMPAGGMNGIQVSTAQPPPGGAQGVGPNFGGSQGTPPWMQGPGAGGGGMPQLMGGGQDLGNLWQANQGQVQNQMQTAMGGMNDAMMHPFAPRNQGAQFQPMQQPPPGAMGGPAMPLGQVAQAGQGMNDAMMHPFAPRNRPQFPGAAQGGLMRGMMGGGQPRWV